MKNFVEIASQWGKRLILNINTDVVERAISQNSWFTASEISLAINAIASQMLQSELLDEWLSHYDTTHREPQRTLIVMAGNLPLVGFFDLLCVVAAGDVALVKPSHKDQILMEWVISELKAIAPDAPIFIYKDNDNAPIDRLIATGSDKTRAHFEQQYPTTPRLLRGTRHSLAIISNEDLDQDIQALREDIFSYSGLGCRNVSMLFIPNDFDLDRLPKGDTHPKQRNNYLRLRAILTLNGAPFHDHGSHCLIESANFPNDIGQLSIMRYTSIDDVAQWISEHDESIQCIVAGSAQFEHPRCTPFGTAQHPTLHDYADGIDTMAFLLK